MCTSIISNKKKTIIGWNLDILDMQYKVVAERDKVYIAIHDEKEGWMPLFGANANGNFVAMPTCHPFDERSNPISPEQKNIISLDIDLLTGKKTFEETRNIAENENICSVPGVTFMAQLSNKNGDAIQVVPGQGCKYIKRPEYSVMTNFSPYKGNRVTHPWMGWDRYQTATEMLAQATDDFDVQDCFEILKKVAQKVCPTVVSMVFDVEENTVYWCEQQNWENIKSYKMTLVQ